jgi:hypothetical protein
MIKCVKPPGLHLLGFKPAALLAERHQLRHGLFAYPTERQLKGSCTSFWALHSAMVAAQVGSARLRGPRASRAARRCCAHAAAQGAAPEAGAGAGAVPEGAPAPGLRGAVPTPAVRAVRR